MAHDLALSLQQVTKRFADRIAVDALDLAIPRGALYGFIGPSGAGKTTTMRMIMSILLPDSGQLEVLGHRSALEAKDRIGYLPEERGVYRKMTVMSYLAYIARLKGVDRDPTTRVRMLVERVGLSGHENKKCGDLSKGMLQKIQFVAATLHEPDLLILDEPFSGLDPLSMRLLRDLIVAEHERGATILFSTHVMPQAEEICDHVVMVHRGQKVLDDSISTIRRRFDSRTIMFEPLDPDADLAPIERLPEIQRYERVEGGCEAHVTPGTDLVAAMRALTAAVPMARVELRRPRLEDVFIALAEGAGSAESRSRMVAELQGTSGASAA